MMAHLPALTVVLPLLAAGLCMFVRHPVAARALAVLTAWASFGISAVLMRDVGPSGTRISYEMGGWAPPLGIEYVVDPTNVMVLVIVPMVASVVLIYGPGSAILKIPTGRLHLYYSAFLVTLAGLMGIAITGDLFNVFVFLEISSLGSYALISLGHDRRALMAAFSYLIMGTIGGTFMLIGIGLLYQMTGTLNMADIVTRLTPELRDTRTIRVAFGFLCVGTSIKLAVYPLHKWLPNAYTHAPSTVSAFLAGTATKVSYYVLARVIFGIFGIAFGYEVLHFDRMLVGLSLAAMFIGSAAAIYQTNIKRLLAYSSIAQIGYMTLGLGIANTPALTGGVVHLFNHALIKGGLFLVVANITFRLNSATIEDMRGLGQRMPITMAAFVVGGLGLIGVPATAGFVSKWYLVLGAIEKGWYGIGFTILLSSLLAVVYVWRIIEITYFKERPEGAPEVSEAPMSMLLPTWILLGGSILFGLWTPWTVGIANQAALHLLGAM